MNDQNYTIAKIIGEPKQFGEKTRVAFTCNETGETIHSLFTKFKVPRVGEQIWGHFEPQEKDGKTYSNFFFGKDSPNRKGGMSEADKSRMTELENKITRLTLRHDKLVNLLIEKGIVPKPVEKIPGTTVDYPEGPSTEEDPFGDPWAGLDVQ